jgi:hypothetical protein
MPPFDAEANFTTFWLPSQLPGDEFSREFLREFSGDKFFGAFLAAVTF